MEAMTSVQVSLPDSLFAAFAKAPHEVPREIRIAASIHWYQQSALSMERAAECAGLSRSEFLELARRRVDVFVVDEEDLARELRDA
jgi:predicted HTH domain antitoxin